MKIRKLLHFDVVKYDEHHRTTIHRLHLQWQIYKYVTPTEDI